MQMPASLRSDLYSHQTGILYSHRRNTQKADWSGVIKGRQFEDNYKALSQTKCSLKGKEWGEALAEYAAKHRKRAGDDSERPILRAAFAAAWSWHSDYGHRAKNFTIDPTTFQDKPVEPQS